MNPTTAVCFLMAGAALWLQCTANAAAGRYRIWSRLAAGAMVAIGLLKLIGHVPGWDIGVDRWLFAGRLDDEAPVPSRMAPNTALNFVLLGLALLSLDVPTRRGWRPAELLSSVVFLVALLALTGYAYRVQEFAGVADFIPMALHTAILFLLLALATFVARPEQGMMAVIASSSPGGLMARRLLPGMVLALLALGWLRLEGERRGYYGAGLGVALYTVINIAVFGVLVWWNANSLHRGDAERKHAAEQLRQSETRTRTILATASDAFVAIDVQGQVIDWNTRAQGIFGWPPAEAMGRRLSDLVIPIQHRAAHEHGLARYLATGEGPVLNTPIEITALHRDGHEFPIELTIWPVTADTGISFNAFVRDITERKEAEASIRALNAELLSNAQQLTQINQELEAFSYTVSHDLRAPLRHIGGYAQMLQEDASEQLDADMRRYLDVISDSARRMGMLIDDLLAFSRLGRKPLERVAVDMNALVGHALEEAAGGQPRAAEVSLEVLPDLHADPILLRQVWVNLVSNALKYSATRGAGARIEIRGESDGLVNRYTIRDNGVGFDMRYADKLFGVFQRLHSQDEFEGTGVGLAIVQRIVNRHGGRIWAEAEPGLGATFTIELPKIDNASAIEVPA